ncbi:MAG TPA: site-2 protease family protein [Saprospiraceae bacterium]|mgnify:CR=1 FL=1|nr:site-2 protease family protein [Saprospiraceae bacterium]
MKSSLQIGTFFKIPVKVHWSFGFLVLFVFYIGFLNKLTWNETGAFALYVLVLFICVILHEYGHALTARRFGVETKDIILSPIGGIARLENIPEEPAKEMLIALAGPAVNIALAIILSLTSVLILGQSVLPSSSELSLLVIPREFLSFVIVMNIALFIFNLVPAFPMDGGRVLRSVLAMKWGRYKATKIAHWIGKSIAIIFIMYGIYHGYLMLSLIGLFIYVSAGSESRNMMMNQILRDLKAGDFMRTHFTILKLEDPVVDAVQSIKGGNEKHFIVTNDQGDIQGFLPEDVLHHIHQEDNLADRFVNDYCNHKMVTSNPQSSLYEAWLLMVKNGVPIVAILEEDQVVGVIDKKLIHQTIQMHRHKMSQSWF